MATKKGPLPLSEAELIDETLKRLEGVSRAQVRDVVKALKAEIADCLSSGYKVSLTGLLTLTPSAKPGRKKGTKVRNPFDGTEKTLRSDEPDKFRIKAKVSSTIANAFPSTRSKDGQAVDACQEEGGT
jgi:nucleoid DNA-binding protein